MADKTLAEEMNVALHAPPMTDEEMEAIWEWWNRQKEKAKGSKWQEAIFLDDE